MNGKFELAFIIGVVLTGMYALLIGFSGMPVWPLPYIFIGSTFGSLFIFFGAYLYDRLHYR